LLTNDWFASLIFIFNGAENSKTINKKISVFVEKELVLFAFFLGGMDFSECYYDFYGGCPIRSNEKINYQNSRVNY